MRTIRLFRSSFAGLLALVTTLALPRIAGAQTTNWAAYNDHRPSTTPAVNGWKITAPNVTGYDMGAPANTDASPLKDFRTGSPLTATVSFTRTGGPDDFGGVGRPVRTDTPMAKLFYGVCDLSNDGLVGVRAMPPNTAESYVTVTFGGLNPAKRYVFRGAGVRNGSYATRWSVAAITANDSVDAHINGAGGPGVLTGVTFPASGLAAGQAAWNSGANNEGAVIGWDFISPFPDGTFSITVKQYTGATPGAAGATANGPYGYGFGALLLAEVEVAAPAITVNPPAVTTVEQNRPIRLSVTATGTPLLYQWYKQGVGAIAGATFPTYTVSQAALGDAGNYYAVVYNPLNRATSTVARVNVFADTTAPTVGSIFSFPTVDFGGAATLDQIVIEFNEPVTPASVSSTASYTVPGGGHPVSVTVTNSSTVILKLGTPLTENTDYTVTLSGAVDAVGNVAGSSTVPFHSWVSGLGNGLLFEAYHAGAGVEVDTLLSSPDYPDNPFARATLRAFDSRAAFADDSQSQYGSRISGVFIPPVSGDWVFYLRVRNRGVVYLNPNGLDAAGKVEILRESTGNTPLNWGRLTSSPQSLRAGQGYYIESLCKTESGEGFTKVAARLLGTGLPTPVDSPTTEVDTNSASGGIICYPLAPRDLGGALTIQQDLTDVTVDENNTATFALQLSNPSLLPLQYQWFRGGSPISGANGPTYSINPTIAADNGATFSVQVAKVGSVVTSRVATLHVMPDVNGPRVIEVISSYTDLTNIVVRYNELVNTDEAADGFNYLVAGLNPFSGTLRADGRTVDLLLTEPLTINTSYQLSVSVVHDLAGNQINPNPTLITFTAGGSDVPRLSIVRSGSSVSVSWSAPSTGFILQETTTLVVPPGSTTWGSSGSPAVVNGRNVVTVGAGSGVKFFRLRLPPPAP